QHTQTRVDPGLTQEIAAKAAGGVVQRQGRAPKIPRTGEPNEAVSQVLPLQQEENHEDDDDAGRRQRLEQRRGELQDQLERRRVGLADLDGNRLLLLNARRKDGGSVSERGRYLLTGLSDLVAEIAQHRRGTPDNAAARRRVPKRMDLLCDVVLVPGQVLGQMRKLAADQRGDAEDQREGEHDYGNDREHAIDAPTAQQQQRRPERSSQ